SPHPPSTSRPPPGANSAPDGISPSSSTTPASLEAPASSLASATSSSQPSQPPSAQAAVRAEQNVAQAAGRKRPRAGTTTIQFLNAVSNADGTGIVVPKRPRKERSDKNTKKGPRKKRAVSGNDAAPATSGAADAET
ncbi:hypothetical protein FKP32DRAFT_1675117, partial [Trametes sanguinea]